MLWNIRGFFHKIKAFFYYGYYGARHCVDFDALCIHALIYAHISRVERFMSNSDNTYALWTENPNKGLFRKLRELKEYSRRYMINYYGIGYYSKRVLDKYADYDRPTLWKEGFNRKKFRIALKKDRQIFKAQEDRYFELLRKYVPMIWD